MSQDFTTTALLASIKRRGMLPSTAETLAETDFLALATEELQLYVTEALLSVREEYFVVTGDLTVTAGTASYALPSRASGEVLRNILANDGTGLFRPLQRWEEEHVHEFGTQSGPPTAYYLQDDTIILLPTPSVATTLRVVYFRRPNALVETTAVATISSINGARTVITTSATIPSTFSASVTYDIVDNNPGFRCLATDLAATGTVSGTTVTLSSALPASVSAGDYVCLAGESPVPQIPVELHPLLAERTVFRCLQALGDKKAPFYEQMAEKLRTTALNILTPRVDGSPRYLINRRGPGFGRR